jgi:hypothetical protein
MFSARGLSIGGRVIVGLVFASTMVFVMRLCDGDPAAHPWLMRLRHPILLAIAFQTVLLIPPSYLASMAEPVHQVFGAALFGASIGIVVGVLVWGLMRTEKTSGESRATMLPCARRPAFSTIDHARGLSPSPFLARPFTIVIGVLAGATACLVAADLEGRGGQYGYPLILGAWIMLLVPVGFDLICILSRLVNLALRHPS